MKTNIVTGASFEPSVTEYRIENIPVIRPRMEKYPFDKMKVGQSFYFKAEPARVRAAAWAHAKRHGGSYSIVKDGDGYRCGRVA